MSHAASGYEDVLPSRCRHCNAAANFDGLCDFHQRPFRVETPAQKSTPLDTLEQQADAHARWLWESGIRYAKAIREGDPVKASVELGDIAKRLLACEDITDALTRRLHLDAPELRACSECGCRSAACICDVGF